MHEKVRRQQAKLQRVLKLLQAIFKQNLHSFIHIFKAVVVIVIKMIMQPWISALLLLLLLMQILSILFYIALTHDLLQSLEL